MNTIDLAIVGAGIMGSAAADAAGLFQTVAVFEQYPRLHSFGSSTGVTRGIRLAYTDVRYIPAVRRSFELWRELEKSGGISLIIPTGGLDFGAEDSRTLAATIESMAEAGVPFRLMSPRRVAREFAGLKIPRGSTAAHQPDAALIRANEALAALQDRAAEKGADFHFSAPVESVQVRNEGGGPVYTLRAGAETVQARRLIICAGAWTEDFLSRLEAPAAAPATELAAPPAHRHLDPPELKPLLVRAAFYPLEMPGAFPLFYWHNTGLPGGGLYGQPIRDLGLVKLGLDGGVPVWVPDRYPEPAGDISGDGTGGLLAESTGQVSPLTEAGARILPGLSRGEMRNDLPGIVNPGPMVSRSCLYTMSADGRFVIDSPLEGVAIAAGFSGHGFKFAPLVGRILVDLACGRPGESQEVGAFMETVLSFHPNP